SAFELQREPAALRDRYGRHKFGQSCLLARRLIEAGVCLVQVNWHRDQGDDTPMWDFHWRLEENCRTKMPPMDQGYTALLDDLDDLSHAGHLAGRRDSRSSRPAARAQPWTCSGTIVLRASKCSLLATTWMRCRLR